MFFLTYCFITQFWVWWSLHYVKWQNHTVQLLGIKYMQLKMTFIQMMKKIAKLVDIVIYIQRQTSEKPKWIQLSPVASFSPFVPLNTKANKQKLPSLQWDATFIICPPLSLALDAYVHKYPFCLLNKIIITRSIRQMKHRMKIKQIGYSLSRDSNYPLMW